MKINELSTRSVKKIRYYPNSFIHREKLHVFQTLIFFDELGEDVLNLLLPEILCINNLPNIVYLVEIILARYHPNIIGLLIDKGEILKSHTLKSIFSIVIIQIRMEEDFNVVEGLLEKIFKVIFPFSMGQNFGVRIYALITILLCFEHAKSLKNYRLTPTISKISELCEIILKAVDNKNCLKYFNALRNDFRFTKSMRQLWSIEMFYHSIPYSTAMPFEEVIQMKCNDNDSLVVADLVKENEKIVMKDELEVPAHANVNEEINLQQKYLPFKYMIPGDNQLKTLPTIFKFYDDRETNMVSFKIFLYKFI